MRYHLLEEKHYPEIDENSMAGYILKMWNLQKIQDLDWAFTNYVKQSLSSSQILKPYLENTNNLAEIRDMLAERIVKWEEELIEKGIEKGKYEGKREGEVALLILQLERRFGPLPDWAREKIAGAERESLESWGLKLLEADSLKGVFE